MLGERPDRISRLAIYLSDKEPLIYLFIINSDFVEDKENKIIGDSLAGVFLKDRRVNFIYNKEKLNALSKEELYFLIIHEAFHIFKKHLTRHKALFEKNHVVANISEDAVINHEITEAKYYYKLKPKQITGTIEVPLYFLSEFRRLGENAIVTERLFHWFLRKNKLSKHDTLSKGSFVKKKDDGGYGKIIKDKMNRIYEIEEYSEQEMLEEFENNKIKDHYSTQKERQKKKKLKTTIQEIDNLIPVIFNNRDGSSIGAVDVDFEIENRLSFDKHFEEENKDGENSIEEKIFTNKLFEQAKKMEENNLRQSSKTAGVGAGNLLSKLEELLKPRVNWRRELNKKINVFVSNNSYIKDVKRSVINYPWDAKSQYGILGKWNITLTRNLQTYIIFAIDTSGSCFYDKFEMETFFTEVDAASKELEFNKKGHVLSLQWDWELQSSLNVYRNGDWRKYKISGGGGTNPRSVFSYLTKTFRPKNNHFVVKENDVKFIIPSKKKLPLLFILTDGYFYSKLTENDLGVYEENKKNVVFFTRTKDYLFEKANVILYS